MKPTGLNHAIMIVRSCQHCRHCLHGIVKVRVGVCTSDQVRKSNGIPEDMTMAVRRFREPNNCYGWQSKL